MKRVYYKWYHNINNNKNSLRNNKNYSKNKNNNIYLNYKDKHKNFVTSGSNLTILKLNMNYKKVCSWGMRIS